jgi:hypothetical protein
MKLRVLDVLPRSEKFNQDHFLAMTAPELSHESTSTKHRFGKNQLVAHMNKSMGHNGRKIREYFAQKTMMSVFHQVCSPDLPLYDFWFFAYAKERMKNQMVTSEDDLKDKLTEAWATMSGDLIESVFYARMPRLEWVMEHGGESYINSHRISRNRINSYPRQQEVIPVVTPYTLERVLPSASLATDHRIGFRSCRKMGVWLMQGRQ